MDWSGVNAVATAATGFVLLTSVGALVWQIRELRRAAHAEAYATALNRLQEENIRMARNTLFGLTGKELEKWTKEERSDAEKVCHTYDSVAIMVRHGMLPKKVMESWRDSLIRSWEAARPLVLQYRKERSAPEFWDDFEWLAKQLGRKRGWIRAILRRS